jgi:hypothetical protein
MPALRLVRCAKRTALLSAMNCCSSARSDSIESSAVISSTKAFGSFLLKGLKVDFAAFKGIFSERIR